MAQLEKQVSVDEEPARAQAREHAIETLVSIRIEADRVDGQRLAEMEKAWPMPFARWSRVRR